MNKEQKYTKQQLKQIEDLIKKKIENASQEELMEANAWIEGYECCKEEFKQKLEQLKKKPQKVSSFSQDKPDYNKIKEKVLKMFKRYFPNELIETPELAIIDYTNHIKDYEFNRKLEQLKKDIDIYDSSYDWMIKEIIKKIEEMRK